MCYKLHYVITPLYSTIFHRCFSDKFTPLLAPKLTFRPPISLTSSHRFSSQHVHLLPRFVFASRSTITVCISPRSSGLANLNYVRACRVCHVYKLLVTVTYLCAITHPILEHAKLDNTPRTVYYNLHSRPTLKTNFTELYREWGACFQPPRRRLTFGPTF